MLDYLFDEFLILSSKLRKKYPKSLGEKTTNWEEIMYEIYNCVPTLFHIIYNKLSGTRKDIQNGKLMDFIPGYRLIHILELCDEVIEFNKTYIDKNYEIQEAIPFLTNYSSDFICYCKMIDGREIIGSFMHDDLDLIVMHESTQNFLKTICAFYKNNVYFLDNDGYLDYDFDKELSIGKRINPNIDYWVQ